MIYRILKGCGSRFLSHKLFIRIWKVIIKDQMDFRKLCKLKILFLKYDFISYNLYLVIKLFSIHISRFRMVKKWIPQNTFFSRFFTGRAFIMVYYVIKLALEFQFDLQNPFKQPKMWTFEKWKIIVFWPKSRHFLAQRWSKTMYNNVFG